jgi:hypothetical protein
VLAEQVVLAAEVAVLVVKVILVALVAQAAAAHYFYITKGMK